MEVAGVGTERLLKRDTIPPPYDTALNAALKPGEQLVWSAPGSGLHFHPFSVGILIFIWCWFGLNVYANAFAPDTRHVPPVIAFPFAALMSAFTAQGIRMPRNTLYVATNRRVLALVTHMFNCNKARLAFDRQRDQITAIELRSGLVSPRLVLKPWKNRKRDLQDIVGVPDTETTGLTLAKNLAVPFSRSNGFALKPVYTPEKGDLT